MPQIVQRLAGLEPEPMMVDSREYQNSSFDKLSAYRSKLGGGKSPWYVIAET